MWYHLSCYSPRSHSIINLGTTLPIDEWYDIWRLSKAISMWWLLCLQWESVHYWYMIDKAISKWGLLCLQWESVHLWYMIDKRAFKYHITHFQALQEPSPYLTQLSLSCHPLHLIITINQSLCVAFWHFIHFVMF